MAVDLGAEGPRHSKHVRMPSARCAIAAGIPHILVVERAVNEARESAACIKQQCADTWRTRQAAEAEILVQLPDLGADNIADLEEISLLWKIAQ